MAMSFRIYKHSLLACLLCSVMLLPGHATATKLVKVDKPVLGIKKFKQRWAGKRVITFIGFSGKGYQEPQAMLAHARSILNERSPRKWIVNIGATAVGIGQVYTLAKEMGFQTTGIVSSQQEQYGTEFPNVDYVMMVTDEFWGGFNPKRLMLNPTSAVMIGVSHLIVALGGGAVGRDEVIAAIMKTPRKIPVRYKLFEMNHSKANAKGIKDFRGELHRAIERLEEEGFEALSAQSKPNDQNTQSPQTGG